MPRSEPRPRSRGVWGWLLFLLTLGLLAAAGYYLYWPLRGAKAGLEAQVGAATAREQRLARELKASRAEFANLKGEREKLSGALAQTVAEKAQLEAELKRVQGELSQKLEPEIQSGNIAIKRRGDQLVVDVSDQVLFEAGQADVSERGRKVLAQVAPSLAELSKYAIEVGGHTDGTRVVSPATQERFPTNWELSTARATNVVRFLQEQGKLAGERLVAAGFAEFKPVASNASAAGRQKNRRIEIALVPPRKPGT